MANAMKQFGLRWNVKVSHGHVGGDCQHPYVKAASMIEALDDVGKIHKFIGLGDRVQSLAQARPMLEEHWRRFKLAHGTHEVFQMNVDLGQCVPCLLHGDEGTTYKRDGCLVLSLQSALGDGTRSSKLGPVEISEPHTNFLGHAFETRFLLGALLRDPHHELITLKCLCQLYLLTSKP